MKITPQEIAQWMDPLEFSRPRDVQPIGARKSKVIPFGESKAEAKTLQATLTLLAATFKRMETIQGNLGSILQLTQEASAKGDKLTQAKRDEYYAKIRSLAAGIDEITDQSRFDGQRVLDGSPVMAAMSVSNKMRDLGIGNMAASGDVLGLAQRVNSAIGKIFYDQLSLTMNSNSGMIGLVAAGAEGSPVAEGREELANASYRVKVTYLGPDSKIELIDDKQQVVGKAENVDLTGDGTQTVDMGVGVSLVFEKTSFSQIGIDKFDYENKGPGYFYANLNYTRVEKFSLLAGVDEGLTGAVLANATTARNAAGDGTLSFTGAAITSAGVQGDLEAGKYSLRVDYFGSTSSATLRDAQGKIVAFKSGLNLAGDGEKSIDFGRGFSVKLANDQFGTGLGRLETTLILQNEASTPRLGATLSKATTQPSAGGPLSITSASVGTAGALDPVAKGEYSVEVNYFGKYSNAWLRDEKGRVVDVRTNIDLTAEDLTAIHFGNGLSINVKGKDYSNTTGRVTASIKVEAGAAKESPASIPSKVDLRDAPTLFDGATSLKVSAVNLSPVTQDSGEELNSGRYSLSIQYMGKFSTATLRDAETRRVIEMAPMIDLSGAGEKSITFKSGLTFKVENTGDYDKKFTTATATLDYRRGGAGSAAFDFAAYAGIVENAIKNLEEQMKIVDDAYVEAEKQKEIQDQVNPASNGSYQTVPGANAIQLLSSIVPSDAVGIFQPQPIQNQLGNTLFSILAKKGDASAQTNVGPSAILSLFGISGNSKNSASILNLFG